MGRRSAQRTVVLLSLAGSLALGIAHDALGADRVSRSRGQTLYVAAYSHVLLGEGDDRFPVTSTLVVRNTDPTHPITIVSVEYRDSKGGHLRQFVPVPISVAGYASREFVVKESDVAGGHSPSFLVRWKSEQVVNAPVVESLMIGGRGKQGISFVGRAWVIEEAEESEGLDERPRESR